MPWDEENYPASMKGLEPAVREKAIDIANALVEDEGYEEGRAIAIAQAQAKRSVGEDPTVQGSEAREEPPAQHVEPRGGQWALRKQGAKQATTLFETRQDAEERARELASEIGGDVVVHDREGDVEDRFRAS